MASATSESYCNHLRGQLKEWERAFRSRNGRFPKQPDYEALEDDGSARGRLVHGAYTALNRATGDSFIKVRQRCVACGLLSVPPLVAEGFFGVSVSLISGFVIFVICLSFPLVFGLFRVFRSRKRIRYRQL